MKRVSFLLVAALMVGSAWADKQKIGQWILDVGAQYSEAYTGNDSGSVFGFLCDANTCSSYLDVQARCEKDSHAPMLVNSESGSTYVVTKCVHFPAGEGVRYLYSFQDADIFTAISSGSIIGFAVPMKSGEFKVVRFSLDGAANATEQAVAASLKMKKRLRDTTL